LYSIGYRFSLVLGFKLEQLSGFSLLPPVRKQYAGGLWACHYLFRLFLDVKFYLYQNGLRWIKYAAKATGVVSCAFPLQSGSGCKQPLTLAIIQLGFSTTLKFTTFNRPDFFVRIDCRQFQAEIIASPLANILGK
tara:strand:+ start:171 stop:575 length:405 start_codon:yes stop_codon:yes gene_type:complete